MIADAGHAIDASGIVETYTHVLWKPFVGKGFTDILCYPWGRVLRQKNDTVDYRSVRNTIFFLRKALVFMMVAG